MKRKQMMTYKNGGNRMKLLQFIVVEENFRDGRNIHTVTGECYIPCESLVPVIRKGECCIGVAIIKSLHITHESTQIEFEISRDISKVKKDAYYDLYKTNVAITGSSDDPYEDTDQVIPGASAGKRQKLSNVRRRLEEGFDYY